MGLLLLDEKPDGLYAPGVCEAYGLLRVGAGLRQRLGGHWRVAHIRAGTDQCMSLRQPGGVIQVVTRTEDGAHLTALTITGTVCLGKPKKPPCAYNSQRAISFLGDQSAFSVRCKIFLLPFGVNLL